MGERRQREIRPDAAGTGSPASVIADMVSRLRPDSMTPFGLPVVPPVPAIIATIVDAAGSSIGVSSDAVEPSIERRRERGAASSRQRNSFIFGKLRADLASTRRREAGL